MSTQPNFDRIRKTMGHEEPDRVPLIEALVSYEIQSAFLGRKVESADLKSQVEFWGRAGYDSIPLTVGMMNPGEVTKSRASTGWSRRRCARKGRRPFRGTSRRTG